MKAVELPCVWVVHRVMLYDGTLVQHTYTLCME